MNLVLLRLLLGVAYPLLAHVASASHDPRMAALALLDLLLIVLLLPLAAGRAWAWVLTITTAATLWRTQASFLLPVLLLVPPVLFTGLLSWWFARTLREGSVPLISRIVGGLENCTPAQLTPALKSYTRRLTRFWSLLLAGLSVANLLLGIVAVPDGLMARLGYLPPIAVPQVVWSWFANLLDYGIVGVAFLVEYVIRMRLFPDRPYRTLPEFFNRLGALGPAFWRDVLR